MHDTIEAASNHGVASEPQRSNRDKSVRRHETPWLIVFDTLYGQYRDADLIRFRNEIEKARRSACILVVAGPSLPLSFFTSGERFKKLAELNHAIELDDAQRLGVHLNQFLKNYGKHRQPAEWEHFYREHTVRYLEGIVALSF